MYDWSKKTVTIEQVLDMITSGSNIAFGMAAQAPCVFISKLHTIADRVEDVRLTTCIDPINGEYLQEKYLKKSFIYDSYFYTPLQRRLQHTGRLSFIPNHLSSAANARNYHRKADFYIGSAYLPEADGKIRFSCSNVVEEDTAKAAGVVIMEVSPNVPRSFGQNYLEYDAVDYIVECDYYLPELPDGTSTEIDRKIGEHIADMINDGDCIQIGIGSIPNAVCEQLMHKKNLGVHTEMMTTGIMRLMKHGVVNGSRKQVDIGKVVCCFGYGTQELYEFMHEHPDIIVSRGSEVNDRYIISKNDNQVSINTTVEVDLCGQCCSESIGNLQISGSGGQVDTATGAVRSKGGRSIIALHSTAMVKNPETGEREEISKIVPTLRPGAVVTLSRMDVDHVCTEYGMVCLRGTNIRERAELLISIAHPKFREELREAAKELLYWI
ncbi:MAG: 4-hydroxybutyrate--acetyl-CoA CoA transferase [Oscillospiraceae bacterium]|jgi:acyl-CoA hydrolase|nr:4-hydroxybutyrate--acetyl-CoA CoA transferase [Oscillospiraceae bacterium]